MTATTVRPEAPAPPARFSSATRVVHWTMAALVFVLMATAAALYLPSVATLVGRRETVKTIHVWSGLALPLPVLLGLVRPGRTPTLRGDLYRLGRWEGGDSAWLRSFGRRPVPGVRFNAGQKLFAVFIGGALASMLLTGAVMRWFSPFPLSWRTGATFVHDWLGLAVTVGVAGHMVKAFTEPAALRAMLAGPGPAVVDAGLGRAARGRGRGSLAIAAGLVVLSVAGAVLVVRETGGSPQSPAAAAVAWEETVDRADYAGLFDLAAAEYRQGLSEEDFVAAQADRLLDVADVKGNVVGVEAAATKTESGLARVTLNLTFGDGLEVPQELVLRRERGRWRVSDYQSISQGDLVAACLRSGLNQSCLG